MYEPVSLPIGFELDAFTIHSHYHGSFACFVANSFLSDATYLVILLISDTIKFSSSNAYQHHGDLQYATLIETFLICFLAIIEQNSASGK